MNYLSAFRYQIYLFLLISVMSGALILAHDNDWSFIALVFFNYACSSFLIIGWVFAHAYKKFSVVADRYDRRVLTDAEEFPERLREEGPADFEDQYSIKASLEQGPASLPVNLLEINQAAAILQTDSIVQGSPKDVVLKLYMPFFSKPIDINAHINKVTPAIVRGQPSGYSVKVEFTSLSDQDKYKLRESFKMLNAIQKKHRKGDL